MDSKTFKKQLIKYATLVRVKPVALKIHYPYAEKASHDIPTLKKDKAVSGAGVTVITM